MNEKSKLRLINWFVEQMIAASICADESEAQLIGGVFKQALLDASKNVTKSYLRLVSKGEHGSYNNTVEARLWFTEKQYAPFVKVLGLKVKNVDVAIKKYFEWAREEKESETYISTLALGDLALSEENMYYPHMFVKPCNNPYGFSKQAY